jgi:outer membrane protein assembly factor BamB
VITSNEFVWLGDSGIVLVGTTNGIDGFSVKSQPANTLIQSNVFHELGIYVKQSAPLLISVSRSVSVTGNLIFNVPRAGVNINDGFYGNHTLAHNVMFNTVRETSDHGPINTWDRQPYLTDAVQRGVPSLWQHVSYIHHNLLVNNYRSVWPIDHDDGSCFYEDSYNFLVYGGKKNYLGHSKIDHHQIYVYADNRSCLGDYRPQRGSSGWNETLINNICTLYKTSVPYHIDGCDTSNLFVPYLANNTIFVPAGTEVAFFCNVNGTHTRLSLKQWQSYGLDIGTVVETTPDVQTIIGWGRQMLQGSM